MFPIDPCSATSQVLVDNDQITSNSSIEMMALQWSAFVLQVFWIHPPNVLIFLHHRIVILNCKSIMSKMD